MELKYHNDSGILMYSEVNLFNYKESDPSQWYNHTFTRQLTHFEIFDLNKDKSKIPIVLIITISVIITATVALIGTVLLIRHRRRIQSEMERS